jgi:hypothetical protein
MFVQCMVCCTSWCDVTMLNIPCFDCCDPLLVLSSSGGEWLGEDFHFSEILTESARVICFLAWRVLRSLRFRFKAKHA